jgi:hypothetical protein
MTNMRENNSAFLTKDEFKYTIDKLKADYKDMFDERPTKTTVKRDLDDLAKVEKQHFIDNDNRLDSCDKRDKEILSDVHKIKGMLTEMQTKLNNKMDLSEQKRIYD